MFCNSGLCSCLTSYIAAESYCYQKIDPGQPGCVYNEQCSAVWPDAFCDTSAGVGTCRCGENKVERATRDGHVCLDVLDGNQNVLAITCPLPEGAGYTSALSDSHHPRQSDGAGPVLCNTDSMITQQSGENVGDGSTACLFPSTNSYIADLYNCVGFVSTVDLTTSGFSEKANGICCPNRAFTCIQPTATGPNPTEPRWWYNAITGMCQQFLWDPTAVGPGEHSPNNFRTIEHCESYCRDGCTRGAPEYEVRTSFHEETPITGCSQSTTCSNNFECKTVGSSQWCCPSVAAVCGPIGGRPFDTSIYTRGSVYHVGVEKQGTAPSTRFFYDPAAGKCSPFTYMGAAGNYNNFLSRIDCELYCARLQCDRGNPLRIGDVTQACQSNNDCPSTHECKADQGVCCPRMQTICTQPLRVGNCDRSVRRYWYSAATRECQSFEYTGCQGNDNNFETLVDCQTFCRNAAPEPRCLQGQAYKDSVGKFVTCSTNRAASSCPVNYECYYDGNMFGCCPTKAFTCSLVSSPGKTCGPGVSFKFFYSSQTQECESFEYLGCDGNSNNFASRQECESYCGVGGCANGGVPLRDSAGAIQTCSEKSGGCPSTHECHAVSLGPDTVSHRCCPTKSYICALPPQQGSSLCSGGVSSVTRYYFNIVTKKCSPFAFNGCDGNPNNFASLTQCNNFCTASACKAGDVVYLNPNTQTPISCHDDIQNNCPKNFKCVFDSLTDSSVCCGATDMGVCPDGEKAYLNAMDMTVRECLINEPNSCPTNYLCRFNPSKNRYFCCGSTKSNYCPVGRAPFKDQMSLQTMRCTMNAHVSSCPDGFECQSDVRDALQGYCCSVSDICPNKEEYFVDESSAMPRSCSIGHFVTCPSGYSCMAQFEGVNGYCCRGQTKLGVSDGCPPGEVAYMDKNEVAKCDPFNPTNQGCPTSFTCQWSIRSQQYQCCGANPVPQAQETDGCLSRQKAFVDTGTGKPQVCTSAKMSCPAGYFCQFSQQNKQFQCCGIPSDCPSPMVAFIGISGEHQRCSNSGGQPCPDGFICVKGKRNEDICCAGGEVCEPSQVSVEGRCLPRQLVGAACEHSDQCLGGSTCRDGSCQCPEGTMEQKQRCVANKKECAINQVLYLDECLPLVSLGRACVVSVQCIGAGECVEGVCDCPAGTTRKGDRCERKTPMPSVASPTSFRPTIDGATNQIGVLSPVSTIHKVCPASRLPHIANGAPLQCIAGQACPSGYSCVYSRTATNYYCCSTSFEPKTKASTETCTSGEPLLYPTTGEALQCSRTRRCPKGFICKRHPSTKLFYCCTIPKTLDMEQYISRVKEIVKTREKLQSQINFFSPPRRAVKKPSCPKNFVLFETEINRKLIRRCQSSCPPAMSAVDGVCKSDIGPVRNAQKARP
ncbi:hypothetical protein Q1695_014424 [Nippostrongylus brasiliensis]|nr:hypothetical protein Q1695_014424 [Nippostrongylus brasiliensis]